MDTTVRWGTLPASMGGNCVVLRPLCGYLVPLTREDRRINRMIDSGNYPSAGCKVANGCVEGSYPEYLGTAIWRRGTFGKLKFQVEGIGFLVNFVPSLHLSALVGSATMSGLTAGRPVSAIQLRPRRLDRCTSEFRRDTEISATPPRRRSLRKLRNSPGYSIGFRKSP